MEGRNPPNADVHCVVFACLKGSHAREAALGAERRLAGDALTCAINTEIVAGMAFEMKAAPEREQVRRVRRF